MVLGRLTHYAFDAVLLSAFLAGVKRSTGLTYVANLFFLPRNMNPVRSMVVFIPKYCAVCTSVTHELENLSSDRITDSKDIKRWIDSYLGVGEWVMDQSVAVLGASGYFERRRNPDIAELIKGRGE